MTKNLPLPPLEELKEFFDYNPDTGVIIWKKKTAINAPIKIGQEAGHEKVKTKDLVYREIGFNQTQYKAHRLAYYMYHGIDPRNNSIDHEDRNGLNNKINNLRLATCPENGRNRKFQRNNTSGVTGVCWLKKRKRWVAQIKINGKPMWVGSYVNKEDAMQARKEAEKKYFGEFRRSD
tara:strand:+ start:64 stop:594 length:531 start_codon:yes stop_codon:yes gene_type:complete